MKLKMFVCSIAYFLIASSLFAQNTKNSISTAKLTEAQASAIIKYGNQLVGFFNRNGKIVQNIELTRNTYEDNKERLGKNQDQTIHSLGSNYFDIPNRNNAIPVPPATYPDKSVPQIFNECESIFKKIKSDCEAIELYLKNKTFTTDNFAVSDKLMDDMELQTDSVYAKMKRAVNSASKLSSEAEMVFLQKSPIKHLVIPMKMDLSEFRDILDELETAVEINVTDQIQKVAKLKERFEKNKIVEGKDFSKKDTYYKTDVYPKFYQSLIDGIVMADKYYQLFLSDNDAAIKDEDKEAETIEKSNSYYNNIFSYYNKAIDSYNTFIRN